MSMQYYYAKSTNGFYSREIHGSNIPTDAVEITAAEHAALMAGQSGGKIIQADENGHPQAIDRVYTVDEKKAQKLSAIDNVRDSKIAAGVPYVFPDAISGRIQTRDERDFRNITGISAAGMALAGQSTTLPFRDQEDVNHFLTPAQAVTVGMAVTQFVSGIYQAAWVHKDAIASLSTAEAMDAYDITSGWPV